VSGGCCCITNGAVEAQQIRWQAFAPNYQLPRIAKLSLRGHDELASTANLAADVPLYPALLQSGKTTLPLQSGQQKTRQSGLSA
jgi:hypothetical protein